MQRDACPRRRLSWPPLCECTLGWIGECVGGPLSVTCVEWADPALVCEESHRVTHASREEENTTGGFKTPRAVTEQVGILKILDR